MDHLPFPKNAVRPDLEVPFVSKLPYILQQDSFNTFPVDHLSALESVRMASSSKKTLASLVQSWLYFGTVVEFFQEQIDPEHFKGLSRNGALCLRTDHLKDLRCRWIEAQQLTSSKERRGTTTRCYVLLTKALYIC
jgi:hypothetical protein